MKLSEFLATTNTPVAAFAELVGVRRNAIYEYLAEKKFPSPDTMRRIFEVTQGRVTANDFFHPDDNRGVGA